MKNISKKKSAGIPSSIRIPIAPPGKVMPTDKDYNRNKQKSDLRDEIASLQTDEDEQ